MRDWFNLDTKLSSKVTYIIYIVLLIYFIFLIRLCFGPQISRGGIETPGIQHFGRVVVLLTPLNSIVHASQLVNLWDYIWVFGQNLLNVFLLFPILFLLVVLYPKLRNYKRITLLAFCFSLGIEMTQVLIDILWNANRVFEIDDLWTNTLGGTMALLCYHFGNRVIKKYCYKK